VALFESLGFEPCDNGDLDAQTEKIAMWFSEDVFLHVAKQLENGWWSSKLGTCHDISHATNDCICGRGEHEFSTTPEYMARPRQDSYPLPVGIPDLGRQVTEGEA
jgi:hypothetical protein